MLPLNTIYNQDCLIGMKKIEDNSIDFILTDIPYLESKETNFKTIKDHTKKEGETEYCCMDFGEWDKEFNIEEYIKECCRILKPSRSIVVWCAWQQLKEIDDLITKYLKNKKGSPRIGIWEKTNPSVFNMQRMAIQPYEFFIWNRKESKWTFNNQQPKTFDAKGIERQTPERHYYKHSCIAGGHPTSKPIKIFEKLIKTYTNEGDIVFDGCLGGGTTVIACLNTNRQYIGFELDTNYFNIATKRIENHSQQLMIGVD